MTPIIPDEAVQAAKDVMYYANPNDVERALTAAAPFLQGVKVKALEWTKGVVDIAHPHPGMKYVACSTTPKGSWAWWLDNAPETRDVFSSEEAAKAAAQSAYEARILSALEPFANSYPQGANLAAHSKNENGPDHEPPPRAQALEEAAQALEAWGDIYGDNAAKCVRALSSQPVADGVDSIEVTPSSGCVFADMGVERPVADGWMPIETAPKDGTEFIGWDGKWPFRCSAGKKYELYPHMDGGPTYRDVWDGHYHDSLTIEHPTHWRPLPSTPASEGAE